VSLRARLALLTAILLALFVVFGVLGIVSREQMHAWIEPLGHWGAPVFAVASALLGCLLVPGPLLAAASGVLFGTWTGFLVTLVSSVLAALIALAVGRLVGQPAWRHRELLQRRGLSAVVIQRLLPGLPDTPFNYAAGVAGVRAHHLALGTAIGVAPRALAYTALGAALWN
jgi:uncharacterized membrane protein YdjX (TVP38/TMEM64 family)